MTIKRVVARLQETAGREESKLISALKVEGCKPKKNAAVHSMFFECVGWKLATLKKVMKACGWESQGKSLFPDSDGYYFICKGKGPDNTIFAAVLPEEEGKFTVDFSGY